jgi:hypothetical protein
MRCPTVKIVSPAAPHGWVVINESDRAAHHELWTGQERVAAPVTAPDASPAAGLAGEDDFGSDDPSLRVGKGPRGKFYVKSGKEHIHGPFETEELAFDALGVALAGGLNALDTP